MKRKPGKLSQYSGWVITGWMAEESGFDSRQARSKTCEKRLLIRVCPSVGKQQLGAHWTVFNEIWYFTTFRKYVEKVKVLLKSDKNNGYFTLINRGRAAIIKLNSILWDRDVTPKTKTHIYHAIVKSTITYAAETWCLKAKTVTKLNSTEMNFWRRSARISRKDKIRNNIIKQKMNVTRSLLEDIKTKQLEWCGHVQRMEEGRLPKKVMKWSPPGRRKRGRPKLTWAEEIRGRMEEKGLMEEDWNDRDNWRKNIIVKWAQEDVETSYNLLNNNKVPFITERSLPKLRVQGSWGTSARCGVSGKKIP